MKLGDAIHIIWQCSHSSSIHRALEYETSDGKTICLNDLRAIWEYLNQDVALEGTIVDGLTGGRAKYISEGNFKPTAKADMRKEQE